MGRGLYLRPIFIFMARYQVGFFRLIRHCVGLCFLLAWPLQSTLAEPLPDDMDDRILRETAGGGAILAKQRKSETEADGEPTEQKPLQLWRKVGNTWRVKDLPKLQQLQGAEFSPNGKVLATLEMDDTDPRYRYWHLRLFDAYTGQKWREVRSGASWQNLNWSPDSRYLAASTYESEWVGSASYKGKVITGCVWVWDLQSPPSPLPESSLAIRAPERIAEFEWSPDAKSILVGYGIHYAEIWTRNAKAAADEPAFAPRLRFSTPTAIARELLWSQDGKTIFVVAKGGDETWLELRSAQTGKPVREFSFAGSLSYSPLLSPDRTRIAVSTNAGFEVRRVRDGRTLAKHVNRNGDERSIQKWQTNRSLHIWSTKRGYLTFKLRG